MINKEYVLLDGQLTRRKKQYGDLLAGAALIVLLVLIFWGGVVWEFINSVPAR